MIILNVTYKCVPGKREEFRELIRSEGLDAASRNEEGNSKYDFYMSTEKPDEMLLVEHWRDEEALKEHGGMAHFARLGELKEGRVLSTDIKKYFEGEE